MELLFIKRTLLVSLTVLSIVGYGVFVFAAAPTGGYTPAQTLNPSCAPGSTDCFVKTGWQLDTANGYVYNTSDKIGIGTNTPVYKLEVNGSFGSQITHTSGNISGINMSNDLFGLGVEGVGMTTIANTSEIYLNGILDFGTGKGSYLYYFDTANSESASVSAMNFNGGAPVVLGQSLSSTNEATLFAVESGKGFTIAGPHDNTTQVPNVMTTAFRVLDRDQNASGVKTLLSVSNSGSIAIPNFLSCGTLTTDSSGNIGCGSGGGSSVITLQPGDSLFTTGLSSGAGQGVTSVSSSLFFGPGAGNGATAANNSNFFGSGAGNGAVDANNSNFFGSSAGSGATSAFFSNFFGVSAGQSATDASYSNFFGYTAGAGATAANNSNFFGSSAGNSATNAAYSNFFGAGSGANANFSSYSNFLGYNAGNLATNASNSNFFGISTGSSATNATSSNFLGPYAGSSATNASNSNFFGNSSGGYATNAYQSNFFGINSGASATDASDSNFFGTNAGLSALNARNSIFIGTNSGYNDSVNNLGNSDDYSILIGHHTSTGGYSNSIALGGYATNTQSNQFLVGSGTRPIDQFVMVGTGGATCAIDANGTSCSSDQRLKTNITDLGSNILDSLTKVKTVTFNWKSGDDTVSHIGFIAQDIQQYFPALVSQGATGYLSVNYAGITPVLTEAIRELNVKLTDMQKVADGIDTTFITNLKNWFASSTNGIGDFFVTTLHGKQGMFSDQLCVGTVCVTQDQFLQIVQQSGVASVPSTGSNSGGSTGGSTTTSSTSTDTTTQPVGDSTTNSSTTVESTTFSDSTSVPAPVVIDATTTPIPDTVPPVTDAPVISSTTTQ